MRAKGGCVSRVWKTGSKGDIDITGYSVNISLFWSLVIEKTLP
jgi:hypothetical protein